MTGWSNEHRWRTWGGRALAAVAVVVAVGMLPGGSAARTTTHHGSQASLARALAARVADARTPSARSAAILAVLRALRIGVYTPGGKAVAHGAERSVLDFYVYNFELTSIGDSLTRGDAYTLSDLSNLLGEAGVTSGGAPLQPDALALLLEAGVRGAQAQPKSASSLLPLLIGDLELRDHPGLQLAAYHPASALQLDALQYFLLEASFLGDAARRYGAHHHVAGAGDATAGYGRGPASAVAAGGGPCPPVKADKQEKEDPEFGEQVLEWARDQGTDTALGQIAKTFGESADELLKAAGELAEVGETLGNATSLAQNVIGLLQGSILAYGLKVQMVNPAGNASLSTHFGPVGFAPGWGDQLQFQLHVEMQDNLGEPLIRCLAMAGINVPKQGDVPDVPVLWTNSESNLDQYGTLTGESGLLGHTINTDEKGISTITFTPRDELFPGLGIEVEKTGVLGATALWQDAFGNQVSIFGIPLKVNQYLVPKYDNASWKVAYHDQAGDLMFDSTMVDTPVGGSGDQVGGSATYHVQSLVHFGGQDPATTTGPLGPMLPASAPLTHVEVSGSLSKAGNEICLPPTNPPTGGPYSLLETPSDFTDGTLQLLDMNLAPGSSGPSGLMLHILPSPEPLESMHSMFSSSCADSFDTTFQTPLWESRFFIAHQAEVPSDDNCELEIGGICSYELSGFQPGASGTYATKDYVQQIDPALTCDNPGYSCVVLNLDEHTTISLLQSQ